MAAEHEEEEGGEDVPVVAAAGRERPRQADEQRRRNQHGGVGQPLELQALDPGGAPEAHAHGLDACKQAGEHAEEGERPEPPERAGQPWQRPVDVLVGRFEGLAVEEAQRRERPRRTRWRRTQRAATSARAGGHRERRTRSRSAPRTGAARPTGPTAPPTRRQGERRAAPAGHTPRRPPRRRRSRSETRSRSAASRSDDLVAAPPPAARPRVEASTTATPSAHCHAGSPCEPASAFSTVPSTPNATAAAARTQGHGEDLPTGPSSHDGGRTATALPLKRVRC